MPTTTLQKNYGGRRAPKRAKLPSGTVLLPTILDPDSPAVAQVQIDSGETTAINELLAQGWTITDGDPGSDGTSIFRGTWAAGTYRVGDVVLQGGKTYKANAGTQTSPPGDAWDLVSIGPGTSAVVHSGSGAPPSTFGVAGEFWMDLDQGGKLYGPKTDQGWGSGYKLAAASILNGTGAPAGGTGVDGDFYLDTTAKALYGPKSGGSWGSSTSLVGPKGDTGDQGPQGLQGLQGLQGTAGTNGKTILNGSGAPDNGTGVDGDFYVRTSDWTIYGPKTGGAWGSPTSLVGPQGTTGATGVQGAAGIYGDGSDGTITFDGSTTVLGIVPSNNVYTLNRDIFPQNMTVNNGVTVATGGFLPFISGTLTLNGTIAFYGANANGSTAGTGFSGAGSLAVNSQSGSAGRNTQGAGSAPAAYSNSVPTTKGGSGGQADGGNLGGTAQTPTAYPSSWGGWNRLSWALNSGRFYNGSALALGNYGSGGASGGCNPGAGTATSGGGGAGGPLVIVFAKTISGSGSIIAGGGKGGDAVFTGTGKAGGGGGGGGGVSILVTSTSSPTATVSAPGGLKGNGANGGANGVDGDNGKTLVIAA